MKRKFLLFVLVIALALVGATIAYYFCCRSSRYELEYIEPPRYDKKVHDADLLVGKWQQGSIFYRFDANGEGATWDISDDVDEDEASYLKWELNNSIFVLYHVMQNGTLVPKSCKLIELNINRLVYQDDFGNEYVFIKVLE